VVTIPKENIIAAQVLYSARLRALAPEVKKIAARGRYLGPKYEQDTMDKLAVLDDELDGLQEGIVVLEYLLHRY
jgi:hypothetical protein